MKNMRSTLILISSALLFLLTPNKQVYATETKTAEYDHVLQDRAQVAFENMVKQLRDLHGKLYLLPYDDEYIRTTIIPEVNSNRLSLAPHYPDRNASQGLTSEQIYDQLRIWFETYPSECQAYLDFLRTYIDTHSN